MCHINGGNTLVITFTNYKASWEMMTLPSNIHRQRKNFKLCMVGIQKQNVNIKKFNKNKKVYFVFIGVINFLGIRHELTHALFHFCLPFLDFFDQVMHFRNLFGQL
jgi:hypothetical protein